MKVLKQSVEIKKREAEEKKQEVEVIRTTSLLMYTLKRLSKNHVAILGLGLIIFVILVAIFAPVLAPYHPIKYVNILKSMVPPGKEYPLGSDYLGRDVLARIIYGARISLMVGLVAEMVALSIGIIFGSLAGYYGRWIDQLLMRITDIIYAFPTVLFAIAIMAVFERPSITQLFLVLGFLGWTDIARLVRAQFLAIKEREYTEAARAIGAGDRRIIFRHILPNCLAPVVVATTVGIAGNILSEAWLSFLGLGAQPPLPSWGLMLNEGQTYLMAGKYWLAVFPGLAIMVTVLGFNLFGYGFRDAIDPRLR